MVNPHWEERFTEDVPVRDDWSPLGEYGQHGEFEGFRSQDDPPSYTSDWQNYPEMGGVPPSLSNPFRYPEVNEEVSISDLGFQGRPPYPEQYWKKPSVDPYGGIGRPPMVTLRNKPIPHGGHFDSPKRKHAGMVADTRHRKFLEMMRGRSGPPSNIGFARAGADPALPPSDIGYDRAGRAPRWYDKIPWQLLLPRGIGRGRGIETLLGGDPGSNEELMQMAYRPGTYGVDYDYDDYGPFVPPSVYEMDDDWLYDPDADEYEFDYKRGNLGLV